MSGRRIKTFLIEDSAFMRKVIADILSADDDIMLVGTATNGKEGSDMVMELQPDVVITDMIMPDYDGMYVVRSIMEKKPMPIILLSSLKKTNTRIFDALQGGAFDFIDKPAGYDSTTIKLYPLSALIKEAAVADIDVLKTKHLSRSNTNAHTFTSELNYEIIVIGASTGGPGALECIITNLPENLKIPVVIAQHMPARFLETFAGRLNEHSRLPVKIAHRGETLKGGVIYIAGGEANLKIEPHATSGHPTVVFTRKQYAEFNYPSIDCLFTSVANTFKNRSIGVILTGMGKDGAEGLMRIRNNGGFTIAQDERSSVVHGMPRAAVDAGAVQQIVPLKEIAGFIVSCL